MDFASVEKARTTYYEKQKKLWQIFAVIIVAVVIGCFFLVGFGSLFFGVCTLVFAFAYISFSTRNLATDYYKAYKAYFVERNLHAIFSDVSYYHDRGLSKDSFEPPRASKPIDEATENAKISSDIKIITDFVDQLSLSRGLFK